MFFSKTVAHPKPVKVRDGLGDRQSQARGAAVTSLFVKTFKNSLGVQCLWFPRINDLQELILYDHLDLAFGMVVDNGIFEQVDYEHMGEVGIHICLASAVLL